MTRSPSGRAVVAGIALVAALLLGGCIGLRADTGVRTGLPIENPGTDPFLYVPPGPQPDAAPEEILRGFLRAGAGSGSGLTVAQTFLTDDQVKVWTPDIETVVIDGGDEVSVTARGANRYDVKAAVVATIDQSGRYRGVPAGNYVTDRMHLTQVSGQWRIDKLPDRFGRWMTDSAVSQLMQPVAVHYVAAANGALIPDVRWLAVDRLTTRMVRAQLGAVPAYLGAAAGTSLAGRTRLAVDAVPVVDGVAQVDLVGPDLLADPSARRNIWAQLVATLLQAPNVDAVTVSVDGTTLELNGITPPVTSTAELGIQELSGPSGVAPLLRVGQGLYPVDTGSLVSPGVESVTSGQPTFPLLTPAWASVALSFNGKEVAAIGTDGGSFARWRVEGSIEVGYFGIDLTRPTYDRTGTLWVGGRGDKTDDPKARLWAINANVDPPNAPEARPRSITASFLKGRIPVSIDVARDGLRMAVISTDARGRDSRLDIAAILRSANGSPVALTSQPMRLGTALTEIVDLVWTSPTQVAVLGRTAAETDVRPYLLTLSDQLSPLRQLEGATAITTIGGERGVALLTPTGVFLRAGTSWNQVPGGSELAVPAR